MQTVAAYPAARPHTHPAAHIPPPTRAEAQTLTRTALERFVALAETLHDDDWSKPTMCTAWSVRDILAHQAGSYAAYASLGEWLRTYIQLPKRGQLPEDAANACQLATRAGRTPAELLAEIRAAGETAIANRAKVPGWLLNIRLPHPDPALTLGYLLNVIYARDTWMHRLDLCRATGRPFVQTPEHDGRIVALVMRDAARQWTRRLHGRSVEIELTGPAGGRWRVGEAATPSAAITMDALEFNILASGRAKLAEVQSLIRISGDTALADTLLTNTLILY